MTRLNFEIKMPRRPAEVSVNAYWAKKHNIPEGGLPLPCIGSLSGL